MAEPPVSFITTPTRTDSSVLRMTSFSGDIECSFARGQVTLSQRKKNDRSGF